MTCPAGGASYAEGDHFVVGVPVGVGDLHGASRLSAQKAGFRS
jgi:hypothetical protein